MKKIGFLFDLDGVLIDSETEYTRIWSTIGNLYPTGRENFALEIKGQTLSKILNDNFPTEEIREEVNKLLHKLEGEMKYSYCAGAESFLERLNAGKQQIAVVTSSDEVKMNHLYSDIPDFRSKITEVVDASQIKNSKPHPEGYLLGAEKLGVPVGNCVVFEDSLQGVMAGHASGAYVVGIAGTKTAKELAPYCDVVVNSLEEVNIDELIKTLEQR